MKKRKSLMIVMVIAIAIACAHHQQKNETKIVSPVHHRQSEKIEQSVNDYDLFPGLFVLMLITKF